MTPHPWIAPAATQPVRRTVQVPGSKSLTNRAVVLAALAEGPSRVGNLLSSRDSDLMLTALATLGAGVERTGPAELLISPIRPDAAAATNRAGAGTGTAGQRNIDCGLAGTVMRFTPPLAAIAGGSYRFDGDPEARNRPMAPLLSALGQLGVELDGAAAGRLPFTLRSSGAVTGRRARIDSSGSSQFVSALLLAAARFDHGLDLTHAGPPVPSLPHIGMTTTMLAEHGIPVRAETDDPRHCRWLIDPGPVRALDRVIEPDLSNAMPFVAAAMVTGGDITLPGIGAGSLQPVTRVLQVFTELGASFELGDDTLVAHGTGRINGITADLGDIGELVPTVAALAALADTPSRLTGIGHLAGHETDRLAALATELNALGGRVEQIPGGLVITPSRLRPTRAWLTYRDHRMAMAGAILGLSLPGLRVADVATTAKTFPGFADTWTELVTPGSGAGDRA